MAAKALSVPALAISRRGAVTTFARGALEDVAIAPYLLDRGCLGDGVLAADITAEPRFAPLRAALPRVVALAAMPLGEPEQGEDGWVAALDTTPRTWSDGDALVLNDLAALVSTRLADQLADQEALLRAEQASRAKSAFVANLAHEFRTPLNAILGYAQLLRRDAHLGDAQKEQVQIIQRSGEHLLRLVNDVIDLARIEAGRADVRLAEVDLGALVAEISAMFVVQAAAKQVEYSVERDASLPQRVLTDEGKVRQILVNLIGNAIKFTERGQVRVVPSARRRGDEAQLVVEVSDTGPGITPDVAQRLFQPFSRGAAASAQESSGLGLALSRDLARLLGGDVRMERSGPGGSVFRFEAPVEVLATRAEDAARADRGRVIGLVGSAELLVVSKDTVGGAVLGRLLQDCGFDTREAESPEAAVAAIGRRAPDLVVIEVSLRSDAGFDTLRALRALDPPPRVLALTTSALESVRARVLAAGADAWLPKPSPEHDLLDEIRRLLGVEYVYATPPRRLTRPAPPAATIAEPATLPPSQAAAMIEAARRADFETLVELVGAVSDEHLADELGDLVRRYAYDEVEHRVRSIAAVA